MMQPDPTAPRHINVLPQEVASKIAAGEVVERPASVVRELMDNAIDAGASQVRVEIRGGGREMIRVIDDGSGIAREDLSKAFLRHSTSKIRTADDLWAVRTLGFRGEALYSIAAVSRTSLVSRPRGSQTGYEMAIEGGKQAGEGPRGAPHGSVVTVRDIFFNLPARLKFLKSAPAEAAHITALVQQYALAHPGIQFSLTNEGRLTFRSPGSGDLRDAAMCVYGAEVARLLLPVGIEPVDAGEPAGEAPEVYGYVSPPAVSRSNRQAMHFFVNSRAVQSRMLIFAVEEAYHSLLMVGRHPISMINVVLDPSQIDVNVHPAKAEVKFRDERAVFSAVQKAVRSALLAHIPAPVYGSRSAEGWAVDTPEGLDAEFARPSAPFEFRPSAAPSPAEQGPLFPEEHAATGARPAGEEGIEPLPAAPPRTLPPLRVVGQLSGTYVLAEGPGGLYLIDQHAAHERILYEQMGAAMERGGLAVQPLLQPLPLDFSAAQRAEVEAVLPYMSELGFEIEPFGDTSLLVRAVPAIYASSNRDLGRDLVELLDTVIHGSQPARWREEMAITLACHSAIRAGRSLTYDEMRAMLVQLELCRYPRSCAHGRPTMLHLSQAQLEREFGRRA